MQPNSRVHAELMARSLARELDQLGEDDGATQPLRRLPRSPAMPPRLPPKSMQPLCCMTQTAVAGLIQAIAHLI